ncbi:MAG TPA: diguanylate cyclase [Gemmatimonadales bacterium]|nr:diguanylate cyclase [Gemmatimonadales bacterium]
MTEALDSAFLELQREYLASMPARLEELRSDLAQVRHGSKESLHSLKARLHRLAGSGGSFGFLELSAIAREGEALLAANHGAASDGMALILERLGHAASQAQGHIGQVMVDSKPPQVVPRALLILRRGAQSERIAQELRSVGYEVDFGNRQDDPAATPPERFPHLVVIGGEAGDGDPSAVASAWTNDSNRRPGAVVLIETLRAVDRLRAIAAGVDAVFPIEQVEQKLPRYARTFARIGPPPSTVLLVDHDAVLAARLTPTLEHADVRVSRCLPGQSVQEAIDREMPDLLLLNTRLTGSDAFGLIRMIRQDPRHSLLPVVLLGEDSPGVRVSALRAGGDDFLPSSVDAELLVQTVITRSTRGRRLREMVHRDGLTGLLNHATLISELEYAVDFSQRHGEPLAFVLFELEGFRRMSERLGPRAADEVLLHVAAVFRSNVRASDVIGRYGWESFGMLLRGAPASGAAVLAEKLHRVLADQPAHTTASETVPLKVRVGSAVFPQDGGSAAELAQFADRALRSGSG